MSTLNLHKSDLEKIHDTLARALSFHMHRDQMNAELHLASNVRMSPLTSELEASFVRVRDLLQTTSV